MPTSSEVTLLLIERMSCFVPASKLTAERHAQPPIHSGKIMFVDQSPVTGDDDRVSLRLLKGFKARSYAANQRGIETLLLRRGYRPAVV